MKYFSLLLLLTLSFCSHAQDENLRNEDWIYQNNIRSTQFHLRGLPFSNPIIDLNSSSLLMFTFDDMEGETKSYTYTIEHYNADWTKSSLLEMEYIAGFTEATIEEYEYAFNTLVEFTHYALALPNEDMQFTKSGNYLLKVYEDENEKKLVITRRFVVVEPTVEVVINPTRPSNTEKSDTHYEFDFMVKHEQINVRNPLLDLKATVLQNGRWDNAVSTISPRFSRAGVSDFDYQDKVVFESGKEFRFADLRSLDYIRPSVFNIEEDEEGYNVVLEKDKKRVFKGFSSNVDINGQFIIDCEDDNINLTDNFNEDFDPQFYYQQDGSEDYFEGEGASILRSDYANVTFALESPTEFYDDDIYIFGKLTDWQIKKEYKMIYNDNYNAYLGEVFLKQGYYNYYYVAVPKKGGKPSYTLTEGNWYETDNQYTVLIYYRSFGERYDKVIAAYGFDSNTPQ